ncbi:MAG TPA: type II toxin-antitoxin system VapC family toxin [Planctomycetaceae bacterium]
MSNKPTVYVETTIPSYLTSDPSRDLIVAANQQITHSWWKTARDRFELVVSEFVLEEISAGNPAIAARRIALVAALPVLRETADVRELQAIYRRRLGLSGRVQRDLPHLAYAVAYNVDLIVSWNCSHIANGLLVRRLAKVNAELGRPTPLVATPQLLLRPEDQPDPFGEEE